MEQNIFNKCIICGSYINQKTPPEHVIPDYLGGRLKWILLCDDCNHNLSAKLYSKLKFNFFIRKASYILRNELPKIYNSVENTQKYKTTNPLGVILDAHKNNSGINITPKIKDKTIILPTKSAVKFLEKQLIKEGKSIDEAKDIVETVNKTPNDKLKRITEKYKIIRWDARDFQLDYSSNITEIDDALLLMSFEYLAILLGKTVYNSFFDGLRNKLIFGTKLNNINVNLFTSTKPQPFHLIYPEFEKNVTRVNIHLFEYLLAKIEFTNLNVNNESGIDLCYLEDLIKRESFGALSVADGKSGKWRQFDL